MADAKIKVPDNVFTPPQGLTGQGQAMVNETIAWLHANSLRIIIALAVGAVIVFVLMAIKKFAQRLCREDDALVSWRTILGRMAAKTSFWFLVIIAARLVDGYADAPPLLDKTIGFLFTVGFTFQAAIWVRELALGFIEHRAGVTDQDHSALGSAMGIIRFLVTFTLFAIALVLVLGNLGVNVTGLVAGLGVGGIAIGLAAQGIFKDLFAALAIIFDHPFRKGDSIKWNGISGTVERIGLKTTRIRAVTGEQVIVGNADLLEKEVYNLQRLNRRRMILMVGVTYYTPEDVCDRIPDILRKIVASVDKCTTVRVGMTGFGDSSLDFELQFDVASQVYNEVFDARSKVCLGILRTFNKMGIEFAFPTQVNITADQAGRGIMPFPEMDTHGDAPSDDQRTADELAP
ncbi:mechanosensitive ion channel family protein [Sphingomonas oryzagri]